MLLRFVEFGMGDYGGGHPAIYMTESVSRNRNKVQGNTLFEEQLRKGKLLIFR